MALLSRAWITVHQCLHKAFSLNGCDESSHVCRFVLPCLVRKVPVVFTPFTILSESLMDKVQQKCHTLRPSRHLSQRGPSYMIRGLLVDCDKKNFEIETQLITGLEAKHSHTGKNCVAEFH